MCSPAQCAVNYMVLNWQSSVTHVLVSLLHYAADGFEGRMSTSEQNCPLLITLSSIRLVIFANGPHVYSAARFFLPDPDTVPGTKVAPFP
jgi:hypothetical protein